VKGLKKNPRKHELPVLASLMSYLEFLFFCRLFIQRFLLEVQESKYTTHRVLVMASSSFSFSSCLLSCHVYYSYLPSLNQSISETSSIVESISSLLIAKGRICKEEIHSQLVTCICIWFFLFFVKRVLIRSTFANRYLHQPSLYSHHFSSLYIKNIYITKCNLTFILIC